MSDVIKKNFSDHLDVISKVLDSNAHSIYLVGEILANCLEKKGTIFWCGNGGSASDSQHIAAELVGRFRKDRRALKSIALTTDTSILTSVGNDYGFDEIFSRQLQALGSSGDILVGISTSGNSKNILNAFKAASDLGITSIALTGKDGGAAKKCSNQSIIVDSESTARIQEAHILIGHILCELIEERLHLV
ncbi:D-sedoheptulose 7-phosphate isomerase [Methylophilaceae bacterium]|jgi:D-sedoheptulose 7-phosphate isomerase|nr:D-sedoheptulose 7-phosphate isomerase [Methylophilaceae bacterium]|tara:strand:+ start:2553 stop:3125 length:573 start_codon:yes stop_codon:yes gene_type:complete